MNSIAKYVSQRITLYAITSLIMPLAMSACDHRDLTYYPIDNQAPPTPTGVSSITMDHQIEVYWNAVSMDPNYNDLAGYRVYRSNDNSIFNHIATVGPSETQYTDQGLENGRTYYYAVSSFDYNGNESQLSSENVFDTPRPEGFNERIYTFNDPQYENLSGFDLSFESPVRWDDPTCDFFLEFDTTSTVQAFFLWLGDSGYRFQDMGYTDSFDEITYAPTDGWSLFNYTEAIVGHTYVILTQNNHYAKVRITEFVYSPTYGIVFDWGYQVAPGNRELKIDPSAQAPAAGQNGSVQ